MENDALKALPPFPAAEAPESVWIEYIQKSTQMILKSEVFKDDAFPAGSAFLLDVSAGTLAVRTTVPQMAVVHSLINGLSGVPSYIVLQLHLVQADAPTIRQILQGTQNKADHSEQWKRLSEMVAQGKAKPLGTLALETRSGQRASLESSSEHEHCTGFTVDEKGHLEVNSESKPVGLKVEIDPVMGPDGDTLDINYALEYHFAPPVERSDMIGSVEAAFTDFRCAKITTAISMINGMTRLLGTWKPFGTPELDGADVLQAAFLTAEIVQNRPAENKALVVKLKALADKAVPIVAEAADSIPAFMKKTPPGMETRRFRVPPNFLSLATENKEDSAPSPDPFAHPRRKINDRLKGVKILEENGIVFPEGANAYMVRPNSLWVTNTPENLANVEAFLDGIIYCGSGRLFSSTLHILQADGPLLRQLLQETTGIADHTEVWRKAEDLVKQGKATILSSQRVDTRSGQRCQIEATEEHPFVKSFTQDDRHRLVAEYEMRLVGTRVEIDPVIGPDGYTMDLNLTSEFHHAPPSFPVVPAAAKGVRAQPLAPIFHASKLTTAITISRGMTRLLSVWKPEGKPEFDNADVLQALFIHIEAVPIQRDEPK